MVLIGSSRPFTELLDSVRRVSTTDATVLLSGETGTGKDTLARAIHAISPRRNAAFVTVDCASIPDDLLEAELFGHESGAFTGADRARPGRLREVHRGTLYLDGTCAMSPRSQARLLRALENREILPLGATRPEKVDFRVVAAAPPDLVQRVAAGTFREDLFYRLKVVELRLPPLRDRSEDIPELAGGFLTEVASAYAKPVREFAPPVLDIFQRYAWPGNVRELRNVVESSVAAARGEIVLESDLPLRVRVEARGRNGQDREASTDSEFDREPSPRSPTFREQVAAFQRRLLMDALARQRWDFQGASHELGLQRHQLKYLCAKLDIRRPRA